MPVGFGNALAIAAYSTRREEASPSTQSSSLILTISATKSLKLTFSERGHDTLSTESMGAYMTVRWYQFT